MVVTQLGGKGFWDIGDVVGEVGNVSITLAYFDPSVPEEAPFDDDEDEDEIDAWYEEHWNGLRDPAGALEAIVDRAAFIAAWSDGLVDEMNRTV